MDVDFEALAFLLTAFALVGVLLYGIARLVFAKQIRESNAAEVPAWQVGAFIAGGVIFIVVGALESRAVPVILLGLGLCAVVSFYRQPQENKQKFYEAMEAHDRKPWVKLLNLGEVILVAYIIFLVGRYLLEKQ